MKTGVTFTVTPVLLAHPYMWAEFIARYGCGSGCAQLNTETSGEFFKSEKIIEKGLSRLSEQYIILFIMSGSSKA